MPDILLPIRTDRLVLRRFESRDLEAFHAYHSLAETARFLPGPAKSYTKSMEYVGKYANFVYEKEGDWLSLAIGFGELGLRRIEARLDELNTASAALCQRLGMRLEARHVDKWFYKVQWATELVYAVLADEWSRGRNPTPGP